MQPIRLRTVGSASMRSPATRPSWPATIRRPAVEPGAGGRRPKAGTPLGDQGADHAGEDVARPGGGQPRPAGGVDGGAAGGIGHHRPAPLEQHDGPGPVGQAAGGGDAVVTHRLAGQAGVLPGVGGEDGGGAVRAASEIEVAAEGVEAVGVEHQGDGRLGHQPAHGGHRGGACPRPGPTTRARKRSSPSSTSLDRVLVEGTRRVAGRDRVMTSPPEARTAASPGRPATTMPAPARRAARAASMTRAGHPLRSPHHETPPTDHL